MVSISTHHLQNTIMISHFAQSSWLLFSLKKECSTSCNNVINKKISSQNLNENISLIYNVFSRTTGFTCMWRALQGFWYFAEKKTKFHGIFRGKFAEKSADFAGFSREKSQNSCKNRPILRDFRPRKVKIRSKIGRFRQISEKKSNFEGFSGANS